MLILFFTPECGLGDNKCSQLTFNTITRMARYIITNIVPTNEKRGVIKDIGLVPFIVQKYTNCSIKGLKMTTFKNNKKVILDVDNLYDVVYEDLRMIKRRYPNNLIMGKRACSKLKEYETVIKLYKSIFN